jgi:LemA protein
MANELDEMTGPVNEAGRDVNVIEKQILVKVGWGSTFFQVILWVLGIIPGLIFTVMKIKAKAYLDKLQQKIQHNASTIDNYMENRVVILKNAAKLLDRAVDLDKDVFVKVAQARGGKTGAAQDVARNEVNAQLDSITRSINVAFEAYPDLKAHNEIEDCLQQNSYLQREITAAREAYNDAVLEWNSIIFQWPTYKIVAAKNGYTTRIPFTASKETKDAARSVLF